MRAKFIYEKFVADSDPIKDMGIGIFSVRNFNTPEEIVNFLFDNLPYILKTNEIPKDIMHDSRNFLFNWNYYHLLNDYVSKYIKLNKIKADFDSNNICTDLYKKIKQYFLKK